jgi:hypothetical protein
VIHKISSILLRMILNQVPQFAYSEDEVREYNRMYDTAIEDNNPIDYHSNFPKYRFIQYISETRNVLLHGSNHQHIEQFEPRLQTLYDGKWTEAVFATKDGIWPVFYAILNRSKVLKNFRNGSIRHTRTKRNYHFYSLDNLSDQDDIWLPGTIYFLEDKTFSGAAGSMLSFNEWTSLVAVKPITRLDVDPSDFYYMNQVSIHHHQESMIRTYLSYKIRLKNSKKVHNAK